MVIKLNKRVVKILNKSPNNKKKINSNKKIEKNKQKISKNTKSNVVKMKSDFESQNFINIKKLRNIFIIVILILALLIAESLF